MTDELPQQLSGSRRDGDHEHAWRRVDAGESSEAWAFSCTICHRTRAGLRVKKDGHVESAADIANDQQRASADERERALDVREAQLRSEESQVQAHKTRQVERKDEVDIVLAKAAQRDQVADERDVAAGKRDMAANLHAWLHDVEDRPQAETRQEALDDRLHSASDRKSSAVDRDILAEDD